MRSLAVFLTALLAALPLSAQSLASLEAAAAESLAEALADLASLREEIAQAKIPLAKELNTLKQDVSEKRLEADRLARIRDTAGLDLNALEADVKARRDEFDYLGNLLSEYLNATTSRADPSEAALVEAETTEIFLALDDPALSDEQRLATQLEGLAVGIERLKERIGGNRFAGSAITPTGELVPGTFILYGPASWFVAQDGSTAGVVSPSESGEPAVIPLSPHTERIQTVAASGEGGLPFDATLGRALALASTDETLLEHIGKGGIWIYPILFAAFLSLAIAAFKAMEIFSLKTPAPGAIARLVDLLKAGKKEEAIHHARAQPGPVGEMLVVGTQNAEEPKELLEEIMLEKMVETQPRIERLLPIIAVTAATAPLLGLLGTVTGMINTFKLITIFGTGDAKQLSSGISEALITTEFGLIVAIPALILHALLQRRAKAFMARMEASAISFVNGLCATRKQTDETAA